jgi:hypothetical protein
MPERRQSLRRASDVPKVPCPKCGGSNSVVYRSQRRANASRGDVYHRRRLCAECGLRWPTVEATNWRQLEQELAAEGVSLEAFGAVPPQSEES